MSKKHLCKITMLLGVICVISIVIECVQWLGKEKQIERAIQAYHEFISGERDVKWHRYGLYFNSNGGTG